MLGIENSIDMNNQNFILIKCQAKTLQCYAIKSLYSQNVLNAIYMKKKVQRKLKMEKSVVSALVSVKTQRVSVLSSAVLGTLNIYAFNTWGIYSCRCI